MIYAKVNTNQGKRSKTKLQSNVLLALQLQCVYYMKYKKNIKHNS